MMLTNIKNTKQNGSILISMFIIFPFLILLTLFYLSLTVQSFRHARNDQKQTYAQLAADAGSDVAIQELNIDSTWTPPGSEVTVHSEPSIKTTYQLTLVPNGLMNKTITSIGRTYTPSTATTPSSTIKIETDVKAVLSGGGYSIVSGVGGLIMKNSAKVIEGAVHVNGKLDMSNTSQIGLTIRPVNVDVAHQSCPSPVSLPVGPTYPRVCASGEYGQPISMLNSAHIYGTVNATNQTDGSGMSNSGLVPNSTVAPLPMPTYDRDAHKLSSIIPMTGADAGCSIGTKSWLANTKITGNVTVSLGCVVTVYGNVWITGNLNLSNSAIIKVAPGLTVPPVIMIDGSSGFDMTNTSALVPNLLLTGFKVITYHSADSCSPDCSNVIGDALLNSQSITTIQLSQSADAAQTEFYARWTKIVAGNSGNVGALAGQTIELNNSFSVTFGATVGGISVPSGWVINSYRHKF